MHNKLEPPSSHEANDEAHDVFESPGRVQRPGSHSAQQNYIGTRPEQGTLGAEFSHQIIEVRIAAAHGRVPPRGNEEWQRD